VGLQVHPTGASLFLITELTQLLSVKSVESTVVSQLSVTTVSNTVAAVSVSGQRLTRVVPCLPQPVSETCCAYTCVFRQLAAVLVVGACLVA
jgi:hypothetical protein